ncbi:MAG: hypothetical protein COB53_09235 [Elusimicrobia bacterium]|nr:MAG: hypothetical protein COB53_09235 [Elusimicrobiota bacterium]
MNATAALHKIVDGHIERYHPDLKDAATGYFHLHRYAFAKSYIQGARVLDLACGEGYGSRLLADTAATVIGLDIDEAVIAAAEKKYARDNLRFQTGDMTALPFDDLAFDVVVCYEAIEHINKQEKCIDEIYRVLAVGGILLVSSPNAKLSKKEAPNPFHLREMDERQLRDLIARRFLHTEMFGQNLTTLSGIWRLGRPAPRIDADAHFIETAREGIIFQDRPSLKSTFFIAAASNIPLPPTGDNYLVDSSERKQAEWDEEREILLHYKYGSEGAFEIIKLKSRALEAERNNAQKIAAALQNSQQQCKQIAQTHIEERGRNEILSQSIVDGATSPLYIPPAGKELKSKQLSVLIPVLNGGKQFVRLLEALRRQTNIPPLEILVADSGSSDGSVEAAQSAGARVLEIEAASFSHGGTRNLMAREAAGDILFFTVQDAVPANDDYLWKMASVLEANEHVSVLTARQEVSSNADLYNRIHHPLMYREMRLERDCSYGGLKSDLFWSLTASARRRLSFVDDCCVCMPKNVILRHGYKPLKNAEDIDLGVRLIESGETLGFMHSAPMLHWHDRDAAHFLKRSFIGVEAMVRFIKREPFQFAQVDIESFEDIRPRALSLYAVIKLSLARWQGNSGLLESGLEGYITAFREAVAQLRASGFTAASPSGGEPSLEEMFTSVFRESSRTANEFNLDSNHLFLSFNEQLKKIATIVALEEIDIGRCPQEFSSTLYRTVGNIIGDCLGEWILRLPPTEARAFAPIEHLMRRGVCSI